MGITGVREYGLDVIALVGFLRYRLHQSLPEIHHSLHKRGLSIGERTVLNLLARYEELVTIHLTDRERLQALVQQQGFIILAVDGLRPDVGHEVLWVVRDCASNEFLLARPLLSEREADLVTLLKEVQDELAVPIHGVISDGQHSIRNAVVISSYSRQQISLPEGLVPPCGKRISGRLLTKNTF